jgi:hypothetical protein
VGRRFRVKGFGLPVNASDRRQALKDAIVPLPILENKRETWVQKKGKW